MTITAQRRASRIRVAVTTVSLFSLATLSYLILLGQGAVTMTPVEVIDVLTGGGTSRQIAVVWDLRLPVALATVIVGAALGMAGAWTQTMARNPLASPDILGVTGGAAVMVVLGTVAYRPAWSEDLPTFWWRAGLALVGSVAVVVLLTVLGGIGTSNRVVLIGLALSFMSTAAVSLLMVKAELLRATEAQTWLAGSTGFIRMEMILPLVLGLLPFVALGLWCGHDLPLLAHDDASATSLGVDVRRQRALLLVAATGISAVVVSAVGPIGFIALISPHLARLVARTPTPSPIASAAAGAALLALCAVVAGMLPASAPVGAVSSVLGGIALVVLVWKQSRRYTS